MRRFWYIRLCKLVGNPEEDVWKMFMERLTIRNFRRVKEFDLEFRHTLTVLPAQHAEVILKAIGILTKNEALSGPKAAWNYAANRGSRAIPLTLDGKPVVNAHELNATAAIDDESGDIIVKIANVSPYSQVLNFELPGGVKAAERTLLHADNPLAENTLDAPETVVPITESLDLTPVPDPANEWLMGVRTREDGKMIYSERLGGRSFAVYRFHNN